MCDSEQGNKSESFQGERKIKDLTIEESEKTERKHKAMGTCQKATKFCEAIKLGAIRRLRRRGYKYKNKYIQYKRDIARELVSRH